MLCNMRLWWSSFYIHFTLFRLKYMGKKLDKGNWEWSNVKNNRDNVWNMFDEVDYVWLTEGMHVMFSLYAMHCSLILDFTWFLISLNGDLKFSIMRIRCPVMHEYFTVFADLISCCNSLVSFFHFNGMWIN